MTLLADIRKEVVDAADPMYVDLLAAVQKRQPLAFSGDIDGALKSIVAAHAVLATLFAGLRLHQVAEREELLETEQDVLKHIIELADLYEASVEAGEATQQ